MGHSALRGNMPSGSGLRIADSGSHVLRGEVSTLETELDRLLRGRPTMISESVRAGAYDVELMIVRPFDVEEEEEEEDEKRSEGCEGLRAFSGGCGKLERGLLLPELEES